MLASFDTLAPWQSKPTMQSINFMIQCGAEQSFLKSKPFVACQMKLKSTGTGWGGFYCICNQEITNAVLMISITVFMWLAKLPWRGFFTFFFQPSSTVSENIWCLWLGAAISVISVFSTIHYTTWHCVCYAHYENLQFNQHHERRDV